MPPYGGAKRERRFSAQSKATTPEFGVTCCPTCPNIQVHEGEKKGRWLVCAVIVAQGRESCCTYGEPSAVIWVLYPVASKAAPVFHSQPKVADTPAAEKLQAGTTGGSTVSFLCGEDSIMGSWDEITEQEPPVTATISSPTSGGSELFRTPESSRQ